MPAILLAMLLGMTAILNTAALHAALPLAINDAPMPSLAPMLERVEKSLVMVTSESAVQLRRDRFDDPFFRRFFDQRRSATRKREANSVGVVIDAKEGYVLTNEHAVRGASKINITLSNGKRVDGILAGIDPGFDLAVVKIDPVGLTAIELGDSRVLRVGDFVVSIGDPLGGQNTIVSGIVSSPARPKSMKQYQRFIQSDAAVGSGVLVDLNGRLIGLNLAQSSQTQSNSRIGFSTPVNMAMKIKSQLVRYGAPQRGFLSVGVQDLTPQLASAFDLKQTGGVVITSVTDGSKADVSGLQTGDVVRKVDDQSIRSRKDLMTIVGQRFAGDELALTVSRKGQETTLKTVLESSSRTSKVGTLVHRELEGATLSNIGPQKVNLDISNGGVLVSNVTKGSVAWEHGLRANDIITSVNRQPVNDLESFRKAISRQDVLMLNVIRGDNAMFLLLQ